MNLGLPGCMVPRFVYNCGSVDMRVVAAYTLHYPPMDTRFMDDFANPFTNISRQENNKMLG